MKRRDFIQTSAAIAGSAAMPLGALAQGRGRADLLITGSETGANSLDCHVAGANRGSQGVSWICQDRLVTFGRKTLPNGVASYDYTKIEPELAESWQSASDGMSATFKLRRGAKFHDGSPVTAADVKWSFDRAVSLGGYPSFQMKAGSLEKPEQFVAVDEHTFRIDFLRKDKLTIPDLAVPIPCIFNSGLVKKHATEKDPWGAEWTKNNVAGGGAYRVESFKPGQEIIFSRFDDWKSGRLPKVRRIVERVIPSAGNRRALLEKGDLDITFNLPPKDVAELSSLTKVAVASAPIENTLWYVAMNVTKPPFNNVKIRQAVAYALPYEDIFKRAMYGRASPMWGDKDNKATGADWPQRTGYATNIARARELMKEAGAEAGFVTSLSFDLGEGTVSEPACILIQEALARIGIQAEINKVPGATWRSALLKKDMPLMFDRFNAWLNYPDYFFYWAYHGQNALFNTMSYQSATMDKLIDAARFESDDRRYREHVEGFINLAFEEVPRVPVMQPHFDVAMQKNIAGYVYWFHLQPDYRTMEKL